MSIKDASNLKTGMATKRKQTDVFCLSIFMICLIISICFNVHGLINGSTDLIIADYDGDQ